MNFHANFPGQVSSPQLFIFGDPDQEVTITNGNGFNQTVTLNSQGFALVDIPLSEAMSGTGVNNLGFQITSDEGIQAYFFNRATATTDLMVIFERVG